MTAFYEISDLRAAGCNTVELRSAAWTPLDVGSVESTPLAWEIRRNRVTVICRNHIADCGAVTRSGILLRRLCG